MGSMPVPAEPIRDDDILVRYLLGSLPEDETERLDELSVSDDDFVWRLRAAENDFFRAGGYLYLTAHDRGYFDDIREHARLAMER